MSEYFEVVLVFASVQSPCVFVFNQMTCFSCLFEWINEAWYLMHTMDRE